MSSEVIINKDSSGEVENIFFKSSCVGISFRWETNIVSCMDLCVDREGTVNMYIFDPGMSSHVKYYKYMKEYIVKNFFKLYRIFKNNKLYSISLRGTNFDHFMYSYEMVQFKSKEEYLQNKKMLDIPIIETTFIFCTPNKRKIYLCSLLEKLEMSDCGNIVPIIEDFVL